MKKSLFYTLAILCLYGKTIAQESQDKNESKLEFAINGTLGFAKIEQKGNPALNGNLTGTDILLSYPISSKWDISGGIGFYEFNANTTVLGNTASFNSTYLRIPVMFNGDFSMFENNNGNEKIFFTIGVGPYANTILKQEIETFGGNIKDRNLGWNFGLSSQVGAKFILNNALNLGIGIESQFDFTKAKKNGSEQRLDQYNGMYFRIGFRF